MVSRYSVAGEEPAHTFFQMEGQSFRFWGASLAAARKVGQAGLLFKFLKRGRGSAKKQGSHFPAGGWGLNCICRTAVATNFHRMLIRKRGFYLLAHLPTPR